MPIFLKVGMGTPLRVNKITRQRTLDCHANEVQSPPVFLMLFNKNFIFKRVGIQTAHCRLFKLLYHILLFQSMARLSLY